MTEEKSHHHHHHPTQLDFSLSSQPCNFVGTTQVTRVCYLIREKDIQETLRTVFQHQINCDDNK